MGYGAFIIMEAVILLVYKLPRSQSYMHGMLERNGLDFGTYYSSLTITFTIMLLSMFLLGSIYFALVAGDIVAKENEDGKLRLDFARPISRFRLLLVKYTAVSLYTVSFVFFVGVTGYAMAVAAVGWQGGLFVMEPKMKVFAAYPDWWEGASRLALSAAGIGISMVTLSSIAFMFSCFKIKPAAATIITLTILFVDMILQGFPFFKCHSLHTRLALLPNPRFQNVIYIANHENGFPVRAAITKKASRANALLARNLLGRISVTS